MCLLRCVVGWILHQVTEKPGARTCLLVHCVCVHSQAVGSTGDSESCEKMQACQRIRLQLAWSGRAEETGAAVHISEFKVSTSVCWQLSGKPERRTPANKIVIFWHISM